MVLFTVWFICLLVVGSYVCKFVCQFIGWGLCLLLGLSVCWLGVNNCLVLGLSVCLFVGWWLCNNIISFNSRDGVSVGLFYYRFKAIPWILNYKWADYWPYWELIYLFFFYVGLLLLCVLPWVICFMFGVVWVLGFFSFFFVISICTELLCFGRGI